MLSDLMGKDRLPRSNGAFAVLNNSRMIHDFFAITVLITCGDAVTVDSF